MNTAELIESLCQVIQIQASVIKKQSAALEQFEAAELFYSEIQRANQQYEAAIGQPIETGEENVH